MTASSRPISAPSAEQDVDLTSAAVGHKLSGKPHGNGLSNGHSKTLNGANGNKPAPATEPSVSTAALAYQELDASALEYTFTTSPRTVPAWEDACKGPETICTDHMITADWTRDRGWSAPQLRPYGALPLMPTASVLHYATECFEGLKAYRGRDGALRLFRPDRNANRMRHSAARVSLPVFPPSELEKLIVALLSVDGRRWLPPRSPADNDDGDKENETEEDCRYLYLRPTLIGTQAQLGVQSPSRATLFIIAAFLPRMDSPPGGMRLHTSPEDAVRAWVGGFGHAKLGANYGPTLAATAEARARGFGQVLWLYGSEGFCTEAGASNFFVLWRASERDGGGVQLVTAPLADGLILDGVTRRSVLELARERLRGSGDYGSDEAVDVIERKYTIDEVMRAGEEGRLLECFAAGTAVSVDISPLVGNSAP